MWPRSVHLLHFVVVDTVLQFAELCPGLAHLKQRLAFASRSYLVLSIPGRSESGLNFEGVRPLWEPGLPF